MRDEVAVLRISVGHTEALGDWDSGGIKGSCVTMPRTSRERLRLLGGEKRSTTSVD